MKRSILLIALLSLCTALMAKPARRGIRKVLKLENGMSVSAELRGDEFKKYWVTAAGDAYTLNPENGLYRIAPMDEMESNTRARRNIVAKQQTKRRAKAKARRAEIGTSRSDYTGKKKGLVILAQYKDVKFSTGNDQDFFNRLCNEAGFTSTYGHSGSVKDYFADQSNGAFTFEFDVIGPVTLSQNRSYYGANDSYGNDVRAELMVRDACRLAKQQFDVDFSQYDWDGDGEVEQVFVFYAGLGEADYGSEDTVWPHMYYLSASSYGTYTADGVTVDTYACSNELAEDASGSYIPDGIGAICHEMSHCFGLPDMYDTTGSNYGMGSWDLLDYGCYNGDPSSYLPCNYTAYEKMFIGWLEPTELNEATSVKNLLPSDDYGETFIVYNDSHKDEYYLIENRQRNGFWDAGLPGKGLMITHVDYDADLWEYNLVNAVFSSDYGYLTNDHQRCTIFHADNKDTYYDEQTDLYPYGSRNSLTDTSTPAATIYNGGSKMGKPITNITQNADGTMSFDFMGGSTENIIDAIASVQTSHGDGSADKRIYTTDGRYAGTDATALPRGMYIIGGKKIVR